MDRSLRLLLRLKFTAWRRRLVRNLRTLKGTLFALVAVLVFLPLLVLPFLMPRLMIREQLRAARQHGPLALFAYCALNALLSSGEMAIAFSPAEVNFLFTGPYRRRQLLAYRIAGMSGGIVLSALFLSLVLSHHAGSMLASFVALVLALELLNLFVLTVGLVSGTVAALASDRRRKLVLAGLVALAGVTLYQVGRDALALPIWDLIARVEEAPAMRAVLLPFVPFARAFAAERIWPDLVGWSALALAVDLAWLGALMALDAEYYEASASASARLYAQIQRARRGGAWADRGKAHFGLAALPWWGGAGPNLWRQLTTAARSPVRLLTLLFLIAMPLMIVLFVPISGGPRGANDLLAVTIGPFVGVCLFAPTMIGFDFRPDIDRMEDLKTLPIRPWALVVGQLATPVLILTACQWLVLGLLGVVTRPGATLLVGAVALVVPFNVILVEIENLFFLWYPTRFLSGTSVDFQAMGRQMFVMMAKFFAAGVVAGASAGLGAVAYFAAGGRWAPAIATAWLAAAATSAALVPLLATAFEQFDVVDDTPA